MPLTNRDSDGGPPNAGLRKRGEICYNCHVKKTFATLFFLILALPGVAEEESDGFPSAYLGASGGIFLPGNGSSLKRAAMASARGGWYLSDNLALELEGGCAPNAASSRGGNATVTAFAARGLFHLTGIEEFDMLFGCERFDPFVTFGAAALFASRHAFADGSHRTAIGPTAGVGAFYHLTDRWSLRFDATAAMAVDTPCGMAYGLAFGLQWNFGE